MPDQALIEERNSAFERVLPNLSSSNSMDSTAESGLRTYRGPDGGWLAPDQVRHSTIIQTGDLELVRFRIDHKVWFTFKTMDGQQRRTSCTKPSGGSECGPRGAT